MCSRTVPGLVARREIDVAKALRLLKPVLRTRRVV